jgi:pimeloyl-ACP methyl ester carboxylesterase
MKRAAAAALAAVLGLAACGDPAPAPEAVQPAKYADEWMVFSGSVANGYYSAINLHETAHGLAGRLIKLDGSAVPLRNIHRDATSLSFAVPALGVSYTAQKSENVWDGQWSDPGPHGDTRIALAVASSAPANNPTPGELVALPDGRRMHIACTGEGAPVVVLDYGAGGTMKKDWGEIASAISAKAQTRVCLYDRAGRGLSDPSHAPRDAAAVVRDLDEMLIAAKIAPPYVLVGHSLAGYHVRLYANMHAGKTAGLVLVDPSGDGQLERFYVFLPRLKDFQETALRAQAQLDCIGKLRANPVPPNDPFAQQCGGNDPDAIRATRSEIEEMPVASTQQLTTTRRSYGDMPLIVLTRTDYEKDMPSGFTAEDKQAMRYVWEGMHAEMAALSSKGEHRFVPGAGHYIQRDQPQAVIDAVTEVVAAARNQLAP